MILKKLLIVDDYDTFRENLVEALSEIPGIKIIEATSGGQAIKEARAHTPDLIVMDIMMPGMDGWEAAAEIRLMEGLETVPVIFCSGSFEHEMKYSSLSPSHSFFITKPADIETMMSLINNLISSNGVNAV